jgi:type II secretory pathway component PulJ
MHRRPSGLTIVELLIAISTTVIILLVVFAALRSSQQSWNRVSGDHGASGELLKAESRLRQDLFAASFDALEVGGGPSTLGSRDGDAVWFLSAIDPDTGAFVRNEDGTPRWQRNILYYSVLPSGLDQSFSGSGINVGGYEMSNPYKVLVRKVIDQGDVTDPNDPSTQESLISDITPHLERPQEFSFASGNTEAARVVGRNLLSFRATKNAGLEGLQLSIISVNIEETRKTVPIGTVALDNPQFTMVRDLTLYPQNRLDLGP